MKLYWRKLLFKTVAQVITLFGALLICSCSTTFKPPVATKSIEKVYLLKYSTWGHHSLAFYKNGKLVEYTYGDWELFALNKRDAWTAWKNMTFYTQGALGRKIVDMNIGDNICAQFVGCETVVTFNAPTNKVKQLRQLLDDKYAQQLSTEYLNSKEGVYFVKYEKPYWAFHNCNHQLVEWLEFLGGEISGRVIFNPTLIDGMIPKQEPIKFFDN